MPTARCWIPDENIIKREHDSRHRDAANVSDDCQDPDDFGVLLHAHPVFVVLTGHLDRSDRWVSRSSSSTIIPHRKKKKLLGSAHTQLYFFFFFLKNKQKRVDPVNRKKGAVCSITSAVIRAGNWNERALLMPSRFIFARSCGTSLDKQRMPREIRTSSNICYKE